MNYIRYPKYERHRFTCILEFVMNKKTANGLYFRRIIETHLRSSRFIENLYAIFSDKTINIAGIWRRGKFFF
jgi:hypothetical protein